jgi:CheY-like chemotaxis protein
VESSLCLGQITVERFNVQSSSSPENGAASLYTPCNVLKVVEDARNTLVHLDRANQVQWHVDNDDNTASGALDISLNSGTNLCCPRVVYFALVSTVEKLLTHWNSIQVHVEFKERPMKKQCLQAHQDPQTELWCNGLLSLDFHVSEPHTSQGQETRAMEGANPVFDFYSLQQVVEFAEGTIDGALVARGNTRTQVPFSSHFLGSALVCLLPCAVLSVTHTPPNAVSTPSSPHRRTTKHLHPALNCITSPHAAHPHPAQLEMGRRRANSTLSAGRYMPIPSNTYKTGRRHTYTVESSAHPARFEQVRPRPARCISSGLDSTRYSRQLHPEEQNIPVRQPRRSSVTFASVIHLNSTKSGTTALVQGGPSVTHQVRMDSFGTRNMNADLTPRMRNRKFRDTRFDVLTGMTPHPHNRALNDTTNRDAQALQLLCTDPVAGVDSAMGQNEQEKTSGKEDSTPKERTSKQSSRILVVEDSPCIQKVMVRWLERQGCEVTVAENGLVGLSYLKNKQFDVCLIDFSMVSH